MQSVYFTRQSVWRIKRNKPKADISTTEIINLKEKLGHFYFFSINYMLECTTPDLSFAPIPENKHKEKNNTNLFQQKSCLSSDFTHD